MNWTLDNDQLVYGSIAKGWKPGGYNNPNPADNFAPEDVDAYELGWKASVADGSVRTALSVFYNDYNNYQFDNIDISSGSSGIKNVGKAKMRGVEFSIDSQLGAVLIDAAVSYVHSELSPADGVVDERALPAEANGLPQCTGGVMPPNCYDYTPYLVSTSGGPNLYAPEWSFTAGIESTFEVGSGATITPRLNYGWLDEQWANLVYDDVDRLDSRGLLSAFVTYERENWFIRLYGRNLADKEYVSGQYLSIAAGGVEYYGAPREYGVTFQYSY